MLDCFLACPCRRYFDIAALYTSADIEHVSLVNFQVRMTLSSIQKMNGILTPNQSDSVRWLYHANKLYAGRCTNAVVVVVNDEKTYFGTDSSMGRL